MSDTDIEYLYKTVVYVRDEDGVREVREMPEGTPYQAIGFVCHNLSPSVHNNELVRLSVDIEAFDSRDGKGVNKVLSKDVGTELMEAEAEIDRLRACLRRHHEWHCDPEVMLWFGEDTGAIDAPSCYIDSALEKETTNLLRSQDG